MVEVRTRRESNVTMHRQVWAAVALELADSGFPTH
jgi:hypothetical protein